MSWLSKIGEFLGKILAAIIPTVIKEWRKVRKTEFHGKDSGLDADIKRDFESKLRP